MFRKRILVCLFLLTGILSQAYGNNINPMEIKEVAAPQYTEEGVLFSFLSEEARKVYLAGSFNNWADNQNGVVTNQQYAMIRSVRGIWYKVLQIRPRVYQYKFVVLDKKGKYTWYPDPQVQARDKDKNTVFDFSTIVPVREKIRVLVPGRQLNPFKAIPVKKNIQGIFIKDLELDKIWVRPGTPDRIIVAFENFKNKKKESRINLFIKRFNGEVIKKAEGKDLKDWWGFDISTKDLKEGGYILEAELLEGDKVIDRAYEVLTVANEISDDLRYGFYANWDAMGTDYKKKALFFAHLHINAIEYYDYFPGHGNYAPKEKEYIFEPLGTKKTLVEDIQRKIQTAIERNILSLAYVSAYAASRSIYLKYPFPMTDAKGVPRVFNGQIMTEAEAKAQKKPVWFYLMAIAPDSKWYSAVIPEFERTLDNSPEDLVSFDGFEIDSYGHSPGEMYYSQGSSYSGQPLSRVLRGFVGNLHMIAHKIKHPASVSFNCVNEYGIRDMADVVDFLFIENWSGYKSEYEDLVDLCYANRKLRNQRVILKIYPADTQLGTKYWPAENLKYILAAAMTGGGSIMVAGEPDERRDKMHGLNTLYYPDNVEIPDENFDILKRYYTVDTLMYRLTHGKNVNNLALDFELPGCIVRAFDSMINSHEKYLVIPVFHPGENKEWTKSIKKNKALENYEIAVKLPKGKKPIKVLYSSPDYDEFILPQSLDWEMKENYVRTLIPGLDVLGVILVQYE